MNENNKSYVIIHEEAVIHPMVTFQSLKEFCNNSTIESTLNEINIG